MSQRDEKLLPSRRKFLQRLALGAGASSIATFSAGTALGAREPRKAYCHAIKSPMQDVAGKVAFITGASSGIGLGVARAFADAEMKVALGYRSEKHLDDAMKLFGDAKSRIHPVQIDVTDRSGMERAAQEVLRAFGRIHVLVNNAGVTQIAHLSATTYDDWDWLININLNGVFNGIRSFLPHIRSNDEGGQVVTISSVLGLVAEKTQGSYCTSKFAVVGMMEALRAELADTNVGVSICCPGGVRSNIFESDLHRPGNRQRAGISEEMIPLKKFMQKSPDLMEPIDVGKKVLAGIRRNDLYIYTHESDFRGVIEDRCVAILGAFPGGKDAERRAGAKKEEMSAIYREAVRRKQCTALKSKGE